MTVGYRQAADWADPSCMRWSWPSSRSLGLIFPMVPSPWSLGLTSPMALLVGKGVAHMAVADSDKKCPQGLWLQQILSNSGRDRERRLAGHGGKHRWWLSNLGSHLAWLYTGHSYSIALGSLALSPACSVHACAPPPLGATHVATLDVTCIRLLLYIRYVNKLFEWTV